MYCEPYSQISVLFKYLTKDMFLGLVQAVLQGQAARHSSGEKTNTNTNTNTNTKLNAILCCWKYHYLSWHCLGYMGRAPIGGTIHFKETGTLHHCLVKLSWGLGAH